MTHLTRRRALAVALAAAATPTFAAAQTPPRTQGPSKMKTHAIGRHLLNLPEGFEGLVGNSAAFYFGQGKEARKFTVSLRARSASAGSLASLVRERIAALTAARHETLDRPMLVREQASAGGRVHLVRSYEDSQLGHVLRSELYCLAGAAIAHLEAQSYRVAPDAAEERLLAMASQINALESPLQAGPGFCIEPLLIAMKADQEIATLNFKSSNRADLLFTVDINALSANPAPSLLGRWDRDFAGVLGALSEAPKTIRRSKTILGDMAGEELLTRARIDGRLVLKFSAESTRAQPSFAMPLLSLTLDTEPVGASETWPAPSWSEEEAVKVWDAVTRSLRLRPGAV